MIRAVFCDISTSIIFVVLSFILILIFDGEIKVAIRKIVTFLPLWSIILGITFNIFSIPITSVGSTVVTYLAGATIPLIMISLGLSLKIDGLKNHFKEVGLASIIKLIIYPLIALGVLSLLNITGFEHTIGFIEAAINPYIPNVYPLTNILRIFINFFYYSSVYFIWPILMFFWCCIKGYTTFLIL